MKRYMIGSVAALLAGVLAAPAQIYIGYVYPAGGQQGTTFKVTIGGQGLEGVNGAFVSGTGVQTRLVEYAKHLETQEIGLLNEQLKELKYATEQEPEATTTNLIARLEKITGEYVNQPASMAIANCVIIEITIASDATAGEREIRLVTPRGISNPLVFNIGQLPEVSAPPLPTSPKQILGREEQTVRKKKRAKDKQDGSEMMMMAMTESPKAFQETQDTEVSINIPCIVNGQIYSGSVDRFRFKAHQGQRLVISVQARDLVPYIADAVPGWMQAVLTLYNAKGREVAFNDDYRFRPDPVIFYEVSEDGEYIFTIYDALYRGREDFVYRISIGELPYVTSIFPLGGRIETPATVEIKGWNLAETSLTPEIQTNPAGVYLLTMHGKEGLISNPKPFALDNLPECLEKEPNNTPRKAQKVTLPIIINGRIESPGDRDVFRFKGHAGDEIVAEINARRLDSPLDSVLKLSDAAGNCLALNDDREDIGSGLNTHHADSYLRTVLPADGTYFVQLDDAQQNGGEEYAYRLRISAPQPDFALRVVPSSVNMRSNSAAPVTIYAIRHDGFTNDIKFAMRNATNQFEIKGGELKGTQEMARINLKTVLAETREPVPLIVEGYAKVGEQKIVHQAVPAEDRMQAFLWRHLVPAKELDAFVFTPPAPPPKKSVPQPTPKTAPTNAAVVTASSKP
jgi:hypothetical protein